MKLSEILGWPLKAHEEDHPEHCLCGCRAWNICLSACDRKIDREALAQTLYEKETDNFWRDLKDPYKEIYFMRADYIISTMPTWLKRSYK